MLLNHHVVSDYCSIYIGNNLSSYLVKRVTRIGKAKKDNPKNRQCGSISSPSCGERATYGIMNPHIDALLLALASSTDNGMVGVSLGIRSCCIKGNGSTSKGSSSSTDDTDNKLGKHQHHRTRSSSKTTHLSYTVWLGISLLNALGCWVATVIGNQLQLIQWIHPSLLAGLAFAVLAWKEVSSILSSQDFIEDKPTVIVSDWVTMLQLGIPMTLNNVAGGMAGGMLGLTAMTTTVYVFVVSLVIMKCGYYMGRWVSSRILQSTYCTHNNKLSQNQVHVAASYMCALLYLALSSLSLYDGLFGPS